MNNKFLMCVTLFVTILFSSCRMTTMVLFGIESPKTRTKKEIHKVLRKNDVDTLNVYYMDSIALNNLLNGKFKPGWDKGFRPIQIRCYDKQGKPVMQWSSCEGYLADLRTFQELPPRNHNGLDTSLNLNKDLAQYCDFDGNKNTITNDDNYDYALLVFFATWTRGIQKRQKVFKEVNKFVQRYPEKRIKIYKINYDILPFWKEEVSSSFDIGFGSGKK